MRRSVVLVLIWITATAAGIAVAWTAVGPVARRVVEPAPLGIVPAQPDTTAGPPPPVGSPPSDVPATPSPSDRARRAEVRTYTMRGGEVTVSFSPRRVEVVSAVPASGYAVDGIDQRGATEIEVEFRGEAGRSRLRAWWEAGPRDRVDDRS